MAKNNAQIRVKCFILCRFHLLRSLDILTMFARAPSGDDWQWLRALHGGYRKWAQSSIKQWLNKATKSDDRPPKAKHVRRLIVANLRDASASVTMISRYLIGERPWKNDPRVAAKCLYIILILLQYQENLSVHLDVGHLTDGVGKYYINKNPPEGKLQIYFLVVMRLGAIIHSKILFHSNHRHVHGNFSVSRDGDLKELIVDLRTHLQATLYETKGIEAAVVQSGDFVATVLWQPMVDEVVSAYRLLKSIDKDPESKDLFTDTERLISHLPDFPYIATTVIFPIPGEKITIPRERWPKTVE